MSVLAKITEKHRYTDILQSFQTHANSVMLDKSREVKLTLTCILAGGHLLIEDIPGMGKTTLVKALAKLLGLEFNRIQFTNDMLPGDIIGSSIYDQEQQQFKFFRGPIFSQLILADEINRATPKTQSACLQAMEEYQISMDGQTYPLPAPFFMIATQNPRQNIGTFPLPESQLDRFLMKIRLGYPGRQAEKDLLLGESRQNLIEQLPQVTNAEEILHMQQEVRAVAASESLVEYLQNIIEKTRNNYQGLSPRAALGVLNAAKAWAYLDGRSFLVPEDIQNIADATMNHRLATTDDPHGINGSQRVADILKNTSTS